MADIPITPGTGGSSVATELVAGRNFQLIETVGKGGASTMAVNPDGSINVSVIGTIQTTGSVVALVTGIPSISGTVGASIIGQLPAGTAVLGSIATLQGTNPWIINGSVSGALNVSGSVLLGSSNASVIATVQGSIAAAQIGTRITSVVSATPSSMLVGASIFGALPAGNAILGAVAASISGTVTTTQSGTVISSIVSSIPSSVLVGASIFGQLPAGTAVLGSIMALQGTNPWVVNGSVSGAMNVSGSVLLGSSNASVIALLQSSSILAIPVGSTIAVLQSSSIIAINAGSVVTIPSGSVITVLQGASIVGTYAEDAGHVTADKGIFVLAVRNDAVASTASADLDYTIHAVDSAGRTLVKPFSAEESRVEGYHSVVSTSVTTLVAAAGTGLRNYITDVWIANTGASNSLITFKDGAGSILGYTIAPATGGSNLIGLATPIRTGANATFDFQPTTASSIIFATCKGYKAP